MYWETSSDHWLVGSAFVEVMLRYRFTQIKKFLHFSDDSGPRNGDKLHKVEYMVCFFISLLLYCLHYFIVIHYSEYRHHYNASNTQILVIRILQTLLLLTSGD